MGILELIPSLSKIRQNLLQEEMSKNAILYNPRTLLGGGADCNAGWAYSRQC